MTTLVHREGLEGVRLLVVDDDTNIVELLSAAPRFVGYQVRTAGSGSEALGVARRWSPDLVVLDVMLPDLDGFEVTKRLRAAARQAPVLFLTARDQMQDKLTGLTIGGARDRAAPAAAVGDHPGTRGPERTRADRARRRGSGPVPLTRADGRQRARDRPRPVPRRRGGRRASRHGRPPPHARPRRDLPRAHPARAVTLRFRSGAGLNAGWS